MNRKTQWLEVEPAEALCLLLFSLHPFPGSGSRNLEKLGKASLDSEAQGFHL